MMTLCRTLALLGLGLALAAGCARKTQVAAPTNGEGPTSSTGPTATTPPTTPGSAKVPNPKSHKDRLVGTWRLGTAGSLSEREYDFRPDGHVRCTIAGTPFIHPPEQESDRDYKVQYQVTAEDGKSATVVFTVLDLASKKQAAVPMTVEFSGDDQVKFTHKEKAGDLAALAMPDKAVLARK